MQSSRTYHRTGEEPSNCKLDKPSTEALELSLIQQDICIIVQRLSNFTDTGLLFTARGYQKHIHPDTKTEYMWPVFQQQQN